jgi:hypothetical protein
MELSTGGDPVMAIGGFTGSDMAPTLAAFQQMVAAHEVHYYVAGGAAGGFAGFAEGGALGDFADFGGEGDRAAAGARGGPGSDSAQITAWVESHFTAKTVGGSTVYDLTAPTGGS